MKGIDHRREAERLLVGATEVASDGSLPPEPRAVRERALLARAQVHATLALSEATVVGGIAAGASYPQQTAQFGDSAEIVLAISQRPHGRRTSR